MLTLALLILAADPARILVLDLGRGGVEEDDARLVATAIAEAAAAGEGTVVVTSADLRALTSLAADQQECGADATSCLAELAGAMDVTRVVHGTISRLDDELFVQLRCFDARDPSASTRVSWRAATLSGVVDATPHNMRALITGEPTDRGISVLWGGLVLGAGALAAAGTAVAGGIYNASLTSPTSPRAEKDDALGTGRIVVATGAIVAVGLGVGGALLLVNAGAE